MNTKTEKYVLYNGGNTLTQYDKPAEIKHLLKDAIWKSYPDYINGRMLYEEKSGGGWFSSPSYTYWFRAPDGEETAISHRRYDELRNKIHKQVSSSEAEAKRIIEQDYREELDAIAAATSPRRLKIYGHYNKDMFKKGGRNAFSVIHPGKHEQQVKASLWGYEVALNWLVFLSEKLPALDLVSSIEEMKTKRDKAFQSCINFVHMTRGNNRISRIYR